MKKMKKMLLIPILSILLFSCQHKLSFFSDKVIAVDLPEIEKRGSIIVATSNNPSDYFLYKGEPNGFQLELLEDLGNYLGLKVDVIVCNNPSENLTLLQSGECDMLASSWNLSSTDDSYTEASIPFYNSNLVLVQKRVVKSGNAPHSGTKSGLIEQVGGLAGKSVYVPFMSAQADAMHEIADDLDGNIHVIELPQYTQEKLVELVANGELEYTICNSILAESLKNQFEQLDFSTIVKKAEPIAWTFRKSSTKFSEKLNKWIVDYKKTTRFALLIDKYFKKEAQWGIANNQYVAYKEGKISAYDDLIKKYSSDINWDWRLLASLIYQESRFKPNVKSRRGAYGLMQMMPSTQEYFGIDSTASPEQQIKAGVKYIKFLDKSFEKRIPDGIERINFILASYNIGPGHIYDAQRLAGKLGKNPLKWFNNVDTCLLSKSNPDNYNDPQVQFGYCKGIETFSFVSEIITRFNHYKNVLKETK